MKLGTRLTVIGSALACGAAAPSMALAGGIQLYEIGTPDIGLASAGYASRAQDASTVFRNPAGMSLLPETQFQGGLQLTYGSVSFSQNANTSARLGNNDGGNAVGALPAGGFYFVQDVSERVKVGFGALSYFGLMEDYGDNWVGRYYVQNSALLGMSLMPTASFKVCEGFSIGAGLNAMYGYLKTDVGINNLEPLVGDGQLSLKDGAWGFGANVGVMMEPVKGTRFGLTYLSPVKLNFSDTPAFSNLGPGLAAVLGNPGALDLGVKVPQSVMLSVFHELNTKWAVMADLGWQNWGQFGEINVGLEKSGIARTVNADYQDTWHGAVGAQYHASDAWLLSGGVAFDSSAVDSANRTVTLPMGQAWRFGVGAQWQASTKVNLGAAYEFMWAGNMAVDQGTDTSLRGRVAGSYNDAWFSFFTLNLTYKF